MGAWQRALVMGALLLPLAACRPAEARKKSKRPPAAQTSAPAPLLTFAPPCPAPVVAATGRASDPRLAELSGVAASRRLADVLWIHNDSGNKARVYAIDPSGRRLASWRLRKVPSEDWEDIAIGPCGVESEAAAESCIYLADTGDNFGNRKEIHILRWPEPHALPLPGADDTLKVKGEVEVFAFALPTGPADIEAMAVLPDSRVLLFTKRNDATSYVFRVSLTAPSQVEALGVLALRDGEADRGEALRVTAADLHPDGRSLLLRTYGRVLQADLGGLLAGPASAVQQGLRTVQWRHWPQPDEPHGEAIAWAQDGGLWLLSDMKLPQIWHVGCQTPTLPAGQTAVSR